MTDTRPAASRLCPVDLADFLVRKDLADFLHEVLLDFLAYSFAHSVNNIFMYRRPILCTLYGAVDFLKVLMIAVVGGGVLLVDDGWEEVLGRNVYINVMYPSQYFL